MKKTLVIGTALLLAVAAPSLAAAPADILWLSDVAPKRAKPSAGHSHDSMDSASPAAEGEGVHSVTKHLWVRKGSDILKAAYVENEALPAEMSLLDVAGERSRVAQTPMDGLAHAKFEFQEMGFYNAYLVREVLAGDTLRVQLAKAELLKGTCCRKDADPAKTKALSDPVLPLELVREHMPDEKLFTRLVSGDKVAFIVNRLGKPMAGVPVTMYTQQGWQKRTVSDEKGRVEFTLIRDYFPAWNEFRRYTKETFLVVAETEVEESGARDGHKYAKVAYQTTLAGKYAPSPYDYKSYAWGLGITVFVLAFGGLGVYLYRRRRVKPFQEVRFDEKA